jgi:hypothetical protein
MEADLDERRLLGQVEKSEFVDRLKVFLQLEFVTIRLI